MLEKTPKNALRIPLLRKVFPDARFIYLHRDPRQVLGSMLDGWQSGGFRMYSTLPGWQGPAWSFLLVPGWRELSGKPLEIGRAHVELQSLMRISYAVLCLKKKKKVQNDNER